MGGSAARGSFLLCLQERVGYSNLCMGKHPWILPASPDFEHAALQGSAHNLLPPLTTLHPLSYPSTVSHQAGKFSIVPTAVSFGTSIAFFGAATMVCDLILLYLDAKADLYWKGKFEEARPPKGRPEATA